MWQQDQSHQVLKCPMMLIRTNVRYSLPEKLAREFTAANTVVGLCLLRKSGCFEDTNYDIECLACSCYARRILRHLLIAGGTKLLVVVWQSKVSRDCVNRLGYPAQRIRVIYQNANTPKRLLVALEK